MLLGWWHVENDSRSMIMIYLSWHIDHVEAVVMRSNETYLLSLKLAKRGQISVAATLLITTKCKALATCTYQMDTAGLRVWLKKFSSSSSRLLLKRCFNFFMANVYTSAKCTNRWNPQKKLFKSAPCCSLESWSNWCITSYIMSARYFFKIIECNLSGSSIRRVFFYFNTIAAPESPVPPASDISDTISLSVLRVVWLDLLDISCKPSKYGVCCSSVTA